MRGTRFEASGSAFCVFEIGFDASGSTFYAFVTEFDASGSVFILLAWEYVLYIQQCVFRMGCKIEIRQKMNSRAHVCFDTSIERM